MKTDSSRRRSNHHDKFASTWRAARFLAMLAVSWCTMTFAHEVGHLIGGYVSGAVLQDMDLSPWRLPYSLFQPNPHPLITLWAGPLLGVSIPLTVAAIVRNEATKFVADFCLLANGVYICIAWITGDRLLDSTKLLEHGASPASLAAFCLISISVGYLRFRADCVQALSATLPTKSDQAQGDRTLKLCDFNELR